MIIGHFFNADNRPYWLSYAIISSVSYKAREIGFGLYAFFRKRDPMIDVSPVVPEAQAIVLQAADVFERHTSPWLVGLLIHGSALKGGFIPGCSDIDLQLYLNEEVLASDGSVPLDLAMAIQRDLATIDTAPFQYIRCYELAGRFTRAQNPDWVGPIPGACHMLTGYLPIPEATEAQLWARALSRLEGHNRRPRARLQRSPPAWRRQTAQGGALSLYRRLADAVQYTQLSSRSSIRHLAIAQRGRDCPSIRG
jgi:hypothetical protein